MLIVHHLDFGCDGVGVKFMPPLVGQLQMGFQDVVFLPSLATFSPHFLKIVVEVKGLGPSFALKLWFGVGKGMLLLNTFAPTKSIFLSGEFKS